MAESEKPFVCNEHGCRMSFTNEDHLFVHRKKHDMCLSIAGKSIFVDQTPTPTRFIRYGEEVGLFQDLQNVNPFEEQFKKAADAVKMGEAPLQPEPMSGPVDDALHTPQVLPIKTNHPQTPLKILEDEHCDADLIVPDDSNLNQTDESLSKNAIAMTTEDSSEETRKFLPLIQLPSGSFVNFYGEPVLPSTVPSVVIPSTYVNSSSVIVDSAPNNQVQLEAVAGPSKYYILPKPGVPTPPPKLSFAKAKLKEKVSKKRVASADPPPNSILKMQPPKPAKATKTQISVGSEDDKNCKKLERNRAAAARFRKKKKQLESVLQRRVGELEERIRDLQNENKRVTSQMLYHRAEAANAKDLLLAHRDCSVSRQLRSSEIIAVVDSSTQLKDGRVDSTAEVMEIHPHESTSQPRITIRRASTGKAPAALPPLVIVRQNSQDGNGVLRFGSSETVIVENTKRISSD